VARHADPARRERMFDAVLRDTAGGWRLPASPRREVDEQYSLAAVGLLAPDHTDAATALARAVTG
jgi:hypothetical protein